MCENSHFWPCERHDNLFFYLTTQTWFPLILGPNGNRVVALKKDPLLLEYILLTINQQPTTCWPQALVLAALLVSQWGDRKAQCSSLQCNLVLITTFLSLQQTAYSLACHFTDNTINQIWTSSSCSHILFLLPAPEPLFYFPKAQSLTNLSWTFHRLGGREAYVKSCIYIQ